MIHATRKITGYYQLRVLCYARLLGSVVGELLDCLLYQDVFSHPLKPAVARIDFETLYDRNQSRISAGIGRISGHMAESLYGGWGISLVRVPSFVSRISKSAQVTAISHLPFKLLRPGTLRDLEPTDRICRCCLPDVWRNTAFLLTRVASRVQAQDVFAAQSISRIEVGC